MLSGGDVGAVTGPGGGIPTGFPRGVGRGRGPRRGTSPAGVIDEIAQGRAKGTEEIHYSENAAEKQLAKISAKVKAKRGTITRLIDRWKSMPPGAKWPAAALAVVGVGLAAGAGIAFATGMITVGPLGWMALAGLACVGLAAIMGKVFGKSPSDRTGEALLDREIKLRDLQKDIKKMSSREAEAAFNSYVDSLVAKPEQIGEHYLQQQVIKFLKAEQSRAQSKSGADKGYDFRDAFSAVSSFWENRRRMPEIEAELHDDVEDVFDGFYRDNPDFIDSRTGKPMEIDQTSKLRYADYEGGRVYFDPKTTLPINFSGGQVLPREWDAKNKRLVPKGHLEKINEVRICDMEQASGGFFYFNNSGDDDPPFGKECNIIVNPKTRKVVNEKDGDGNYVAMRWDTDAGDAGEWVRDTE